MTNYRTLAEIIWEKGNYLQELIEGRFAFVEIEDCGDPLPVATIGLDKWHIFFLNGDESAEYGTLIANLFRHTDGVCPFVFEEFRFYASGVTQGGEVFLLLDGDVPPFMGEESSFISDALFHLLMPMNDWTAATMCEMLSEECSTAATRAALLASAGAYLIHSGDDGEGSPRCAVRYMQRAFELTNEERYFMRAVEISLSIGSDGLPVGGLDQTEGMPWRWRMRPLTDDDNLTLLRYSALRLAAERELSNPQDFDDAVAAVEYALERMSDAIDDENRAAYDIAIAWLKARKRLACNDASLSDYEESPLAVLMLLASGAAAIDGPGTPGHP